METTICARKHEKHRKFTSDAHDLFSKILAPFAKNLGAVIPFVA